MTQCIEKFEALNDVQEIANVILTFTEGYLSYYVIQWHHIYYFVLLYSGDFTVQSDHGVTSVFGLLYEMAEIMAKKSNKLQMKTHKINMYCRILWSEYL